MSLYSIASHHCPQSVPRQSDANVLRSQDSLSLHESSSRTTERGQDGPTKGTNNSRSPPLFCFFLQAGLKCALLLPGVIGMHHLPGQFTSSWLHWPSLGLSQKPQECPNPDKAPGQRKALLPLTADRCLRPRLWLL